MIPIRALSKICRPGRLGQWIAVITVSLCAMSAALGFAWTSGALPKIRSGEAGFTLTLDEESWIASLLFLGYLISPIPSAYFMDKIGRRNTLCMAIWIHVLAFIIISTTKGFWWLLVARILKGIWVGLVYTVVPAYIGECVDPSIRGILGTFYGCFLYVGSLLVSFIGAYFSYLFLSWFSVMFNVCLAVLLCLIPESPYYYLSKNDTASARISLAWLRGYCNETVLNSMVESVKKSKTNEASFSQVFTRPATRKGFFIVSLLGSIQRSSGLAILLTYTSVTLPNYIVTPEEFTIVLNIVWIISSLSSGLVMDKFGRRALMGFSCAGSSIMMLGVATWFFLRDKTDIDVSSIIWLPFVLLILHGVFYSFGIVSIPTLAPGEVFSPDIKSKASSLVSIWVALVSGIIINIYLPLDYSVGRYSNFLICSISSFIGLLTSIFIMVETKGRTLEEIQDALEGKKMIQEKFPESTKF